MTIKLSDPVLGVCSECQAVHPAIPRTDLLYAELDSPNGPFGCGEAGHFIMDTHNFGETTLSCGGTGTTPEAVMILENIVGVANCGCVYSAEDGIPCKHDLALAVKTAVAR